MSNIRSNRYILAASVFTGIGATLWNVYLYNNSIEFSLFVGVVALGISAGLHLVWRERQKRK